MESKLLTNNITCLLFVELQQNILRVCKQVGNLTSLTLLLFQYSRTGLICDPSGPVEHGDYYSFLFQIPIENCMSATNKPFFPIIIPNLLNSSIGICRGPAQILRSYV